MGMPQVPKRDHLPSIEEVVIQILESVALEELAMAHIINAEGEKMQALVKQMDKSNVCSDCISGAFKNTNATINSLIMKEWIMLNKIKTALEIYTEFEKEEKPCKCHGECDSPCTCGEKHCKKEEKPCATGKCIKESGYDDKFEKKEYKEKCDGNYTEIKY